MKKILLFLILLISCSIETEIRDGYFVYDERSPEQVIELLGDTIDQYENYYGECKYNACIWLRKEHWTSYGQEVAGTFIGRRGDNCCFIQVGVNKTDSCGTAHVLMHELKRCCFDIYTNTEWEWTHDIYYAVLPLKESGKCGEVSYNPYVWR